MFVTSNHQNFSDFQEIDDLLLSLYMEIDLFRASIALCNSAFDRRDLILCSGNIAPNAIKDMRLYEQHALIGAQSAINFLFQIREILKYMEIWNSSHPLASKLLLNPDFGRSTIQSFETSFPQLKSLRNATFHSAEIRADPVKNAHNAALSGSKTSFVKPKGSSWLIQRHFEGRVFFTVRQGELLKFDTGLRSFEKILSVYAEVLHDLAFA